MRRVIAVTTTALMVGAVAVTVLGSSPSLAEAPSLHPELHPPVGQTALRNGESEARTVRFAGTVTPGSELVSAFIHFERADGSDFRTPLDVYPSVTFGPDGSISGTRALNLSPNNPPGSPNGHGGRVFLVLTARDPGPTGKDATAQSNDVPIDLVGPVISKVKMTRTDTVSVRFSEDVHLLTQADAVVDWRVEGVPPIAITGSAREKILTIANTQDEDDTPRVQYSPLGGRETYRDTTANNVYAGGQGIDMWAQDAVAPQIPTVDEVAGKPGTSAAANDPTPQIKVSDIRSGHWAEIYLEANGQPGLQDPGDAFVGEDEADATGAQVNVRDLTNDGTYTLYAIARDNALCDPPSDSTMEHLCPNWSGANAGSTVTYTLDRIAPTALFAAITNVNEVTVGLTEAVFGTNNPANWTISGAVVTGVSGSGDRRTLMTTGASPGATVTYTPGNYADQAGNALGGFSTTLLNQLPPILEFTDPGGDTYVQSTTYNLKGTAQDAAQVEIFRDDDGNGTPDTGSPIATATVGGTAWSADVPLNSNATNRFVGRALRPGVQGPNVRLDAVLVQDSINPSLSMGQFDSAYRGNLQVDISWTANDANFSQAPGPMKIEFSPDGGTTWRVLEENYPNESPYEDWVTDLINTKNALIRLTATDRAGRSTTAVSPAIEIDSLPPVFIPTITDATHIDLSFSEGVNGLFAPLEWKIDGQPAGQMDPAGPNNGVTKATLTTSPLSPPMDPTAPPDVEYGSANPLPVATELVDHVGNPLIEGSRVVQAQPPPGPGDPSGSVCSILGTEGADTLLGTEGPDVICPLAGTDHIVALGGDDIIVTGLGAKTVDGGAGNDEINGGPEADTLLGGAGNDLILAYDGDDSIDGGDGDDRLHGDDGGDDIKAGPGVDILEGEGGNDHLSGGSETDYLEGSNGNDSLGGGDGNDRLNGHGGEDALRGDAGDDLLDGGEGVDSVDGGDGNDKVEGTSGADKLFGSDGNDLLKGGSENDQLSGGKGRDTLSGQSGRDGLTGDGGRDRLKGGAGRDQLIGSKGRDFCSGGRGADRKVTCERGPKS